MSKNLSALTTDLISSTGNTARNVINAYRVGNERVAGFIDQRWETAVMKTGKALTAEARSNALAAQKKISGYYTRGITLTSDGADTVVNKAVELAANGVQQLAANATRFEKSTGVTTLNTLAIAAVPAAQSLTKVAALIEKQSGEFASKVSGKSVKAKVAAVKRTTAFKKARAATNV